MNEIVRNGGLTGKSLRKLSLLLSLAFCLAFASPLHAEDLTLTDGTVYKNVTVLKAEPDGLKIVHSDGGGKVPFSKLPTAIQQKYHYDPVAAQKYIAEQDAKTDALVRQRLQESLAKASATSSTATQPAAAATTVTTPAPSPAPAARTIPDKIYPLVLRKLDYFDGTRLATFNDAKLSSVRYYAIYYSAHWCGPCRQFTPELVKFYNEFKPTHPNFELIFVSLDNSETDMLEYMKSNSMIWPAYRYSQIERGPNGSAKGSGIQQFFGRGIPDLVLVDSTTLTVMSDSYTATEYVGPYKVMDDIRKMVK